jgi:hypothetical protein|tara:strand:- start:118 stop:324 length:207 start_codon:yes stop_codon:yes gene_type:complete
MIRSELRATGTALDEPVTWLGTVVRVRARVKMRVRVRIWVRRDSHRVQHSHLGKLFELLAHVGRDHGA